MPKDNLKENQMSQEKPCNHFMVWNVQGGYAYYRCSKCNYIDGKKTFDQVREETKKEILGEIEKMNLLEDNPKGTTDAYKQALSDVKEIIKKI